MSRAAFLSCTLAAITASLAACSSDPTITWADTSADEREYAIARVFDSGRGEFSVFGFVLDETTRNPGCPARSETADTMTFVADGCTNAEGITFHGRMELVRTGTGTPVERDQLSFDGFRMENEFSRLALDGTVVYEQTPERQTIETHMTSATRELSLRLDLDIVCEGLSCKSAEGATGSIAGRGEFTIELEDFGDSSFGDDSLVLRGTDELSAGPTDLSCRDYFLDGVEVGEVCE